MLSSCSSTVEKKTIAAPINEEAQAAVALLFTFYKSNMQLSEIHLKEQAKININTFIDQTKTQVKWIEDSTLNEEIAFKVIPAVVQNKNIIQIHYAEAAFNDHPATLNLTHFLEAILNKYSLFDFYNKSLNNDALTFYTLAKIRKSILTQMSKTPLYPIETSQYNGYVLGESLLWDKRLANFEKIEKNKRVQLKDYSRNIAMTSKAEVELKLNLSQEGHNKLKAIFLKNFKGEESQRSDFYFDIFKNSSYQLKASTPAVKIRLQQDDDLSWQTQKTLSSSTLSIFSVKKTESVSMNVTRDQELLDSITNYHTKLTALDSYSLVLAAGIQKGLDSKGLIVFAQSLCPQCRQNEPYYSTHQNTKKRVKIKLKIGEEQFVILVGETNNRGVLSYELEAEVKKSKDIMKSAENLEKWLYLNGLESIHVDQSLVEDPTQFSAQQLRQLL